MIFFSLENCKCNKHTKIQCNTLKEKTLSLRSLTLIIRASLHIIFFLLVKEIQIEEKNQNKHDFKIIHM